MRVLLGLAVPSLMWFSWCLLWLLLLAFLPSLSSTREVRSSTYDSAWDQGLGWLWGPPPASCLPHCQPVASSLLVVMHYVQEETQRLLLLPTDLRQEELGVLLGSTASPGPGPVVGVSGWWGGGEVSSSSVSSREPLCMCVE